MVDEQSKIEDHCDWKAERLTKEVLNTLDEDGEKEFKEIPRNQNMEEVREGVRRALIAERKTQLKLGGYNGKNV